MKVKRSALTYLVEVETKMHSTEKVSGFYTEKFSERVFFARFKGNNKFRLIFIFVYISISYVRLCGCLIGHGTKIATVLKVQVGS